MNRITLIIAALALAGPAAFAQPEPPKPPKPPKPPREMRIYAPGASASFLGVGVTDIDAERAKALKLKEERGVEVNSVDNDSPAAKAGIKTNDVILEYNGQPVEGNEQFRRLVSETPVGRQVKMSVWRNGSMQTLTATVGSRPAGSIFFNGDDLRFRMPEIRIPEIPRPVIAWQSRTLGVESESLNPQLSEYFGVKEGVLVRAVNKGSAAEKAGFKAGDVITKVGDRRISNPRDISNALREAPSGKPLAITITRDRKEMTLNIPIEDKSSEHIHAERMVRMNL